MNPSAVCLNSYGCLCSNVSWSPGSPSSVRAWRPSTALRAEDEFEYGPEHGDPNEIALITIGATTYRFQAIGENLATWDGPGSVANLSPAADGGDGLWELSDPFGGAIIDSILFGAETPPGWSGGNNSDYSLAALRTVAVPEATSSGVLLALALAGLGSLGRRVRG